MVPETSISGGFAFGVNPEIAAETETRLILDTAFAGYEEISLFAAGLLLVEFILLLLCRPVGDEI